MSFWRGELQRVLAWIKRFEFGDDPVTLGPGGISTTGPVSAGSLTATSTDAGATVGPIVTLYRNSASPAASDVIGQVLFQGEDSAGNTESYAGITATITDPTSGSEDATLALFAKIAGVSTTHVTVGASLLTLGSNIAIAFGGTGAATTRTNLGLGTAATRNTGTSGANVPLLNGNNTYSGSSAFTGSLAVSDVNLVITGSADATKTLTFQIDGFSTDTNRVITIPNATTEMVGTNTSQALTNKSLTITDANLTITGSADFTKTLTFQIDGFTTGTNRVVTFPDENITLVPIVTGTWTPTLTGVTNVDSVTAQLCHYVRIGNNVHCWGFLTVDPTASGTLTHVRMTLPIASNFAASTDLMGVASANSAQRGGTLNADATNDTASVFFTSEGTASLSLVFQFDYVVI